MSENSEESDHKDEDEFVDVMNDSDNDESLTIPTLPEADSQIPDYIQDIPNIDKPFQ